MINDDNDKYWYALKVFYNRVYQVEKQLTTEGVKSYIPVRCVEKTIGNKTVRRHEPAVSSLMFVHAREADVLEWQERLKNTTPLMAYFDRASRKPASIPDREMQAFMATTSSCHPDLEYFPEGIPNLQSGDRVRVTDGPFRGAEGYIKRIKGNRRLVVSIEGVVAVATAYIPGAFLEKIPDE